MNVKSFAVAVALSFGSVVPAEGPARLSEIDDLRPLTQRWRALGDDIGVAGYAVALIRDGEIIAAEGFGVRDPATGQHVDRDTMFYIASCTKTYIAGAIVKLADEGAVDLDAPVQHYLPEFSLADGDSASSITLRDLLGHRPGLNSPLVVFLDAYTGEITDDRYFRLLSKETPLGEIAYTNVHFTLLGRVVRRVAGKDWREYLEDAVFVPGGMTRTTGYASELYTDPNVAFPTETGENGLERSAIVKTDRVMHAAGGLGSSVLDAATWVLLHVGGSGVPRVLSDDAVDEMLRYQSRFEEGRGGIRTIHGYAAGWQAGVWRRGDVRYYQHAGGYAGTSAHLSFMPDEGLGVVVLSNHTPEGRAMCDVISIDFYDHELGVTERDDPVTWYINNVTEYRKNSRAASSQRLTSDGLSAPVRRYLGDYHSDDLGMLSVAMDQGELIVRIGVMEYASRDAGERDQMVLETEGDAILARFSLVDGQPTAIEIELNGAFHRFERLGGE